MAKRKTIEKRRKKANRQMNAHGMSKYEVKMKKRAETSEEDEKR